jgi:hypothetical protein
MKKKKLKIKTLPKTKPKLRSNTELVGRVNKFKFKKGVRMI